MPTISHDSLREYGAAIFAAAGFPADQGRMSPITWSIPISLGMTLTGSFACPATLRQCERGI